VLAPPGLGLAPLEAGEVPFATAPAAGNKRSESPGTRRREITLASVPSQREERFSRSDGPPPTRKRGGGVYWLLVVPFFGTFFPWIFNFQDPEFIGIPFFYWYQMAWIPITVIITVFVYRATSGRS
jgi:hypothetical protein